MENKKVIIGLGIILLLFLAGGGYYFIAGKASKPVEVKSQEQQEEIIPTIVPDQLGLTLMARSDKKAIKFEIANAKDITSVDYEISYLAKGNVPRGAIGTLKAKEGEVNMSTNYIELGSCSSGKCKYDEGVTSVKLILKINKTNGKAYQTEKALDL